MRYMEVLLVYTPRYILFIYKNSRKILFIFLEFL